MRTHDVERNLVRSKMARFKDRSNLPADLNVSIPRISTPTTAVDGKKELESPLVCFDRFASTKEGPKMEEARGEQPGKTRKLSTITESVYPCQLEGNSMHDLGSENLNSNGRPSLVMTAGGRDSHLDFQSPKGQNLSLFSGQKNYQYRKLSSFNKLEVERPASLLDLPKSGVQGSNNEKSGAASVNENSILLEHADQAGPLPSPAHLEESDRLFKTPVLTKIVSDYHQFDSHQDRQENRADFLMQDSTVLKHDLVGRVGYVQGYTAPLADGWLMGYSNHQVVLPKHGLHLSTEKPHSPHQGSRASSPRDDFLTRPAVGDKHSPDEAAIGFLSFRKSLKDKPSDTKPPGSENTKPHKNVPLPQDESASESTISETSLGLPNQLEAPQNLFTGIPPATATKMIKQLEEEKLHIENKLKLVNKRIRLLKKTLSPKAEAKPSPGRTAVNSVEASPDAKTRATSITKHKAFVVRTKTSRGEHSAHTDATTRGKSVFAKKEQPQPSASQRRERSDSSDNLDFTRLNQYINMLAVKAKPATEQAIPTKPNPQDQASKDRRSFYSQVRDTSNRLSLLSKRDSMVSMYEKMGNRHSYSRSKTDIFG